MTNERMKNKQQHIVSNEAGKSFHGDDQNTTTAKMAEGKGQMIMTK